jgi:hypothetical protein
MVTPRDDGVGGKCLAMTVKRHCERSVAIQCLGKLNCWIAASQAPRDDGVGGKCLAMTVKRHCERSVAIQCLGMHSIWIATSQAPRDDWVGGKCLAMTVWGAETTKGPVGPFCAVRC